jgi:hypothetical protein
MKPFRRLALLLIVPLFCLSLSSCCVFRGDCQSKPGQIATLVVDCTLAAVKATATEILPAVIALITSSGTDWSKMLDLLKQAGLDALSCSLQQAGQEVQNMTALGPGVMIHPLIKMTVTPAVVQQRVNQYLSDMVGPDGKHYRIEFKK